MKRLIPSFLLAGLAAGCASVPAPVASIPANLAPSANERLLVTVPATGVQIYECRAVKDKAGQFEWSFVAPEADLFDRSGAKIGKHYAGPHWEASDGSRVVASVSERAPAPSAGAIPWLLLAAKAAGPDGRFAKVSSIQRVNTVGGIAPATGCSQASLGAKARVDYKADYHLFVRTPDAVTEWNGKAGELIAEARMGTPPAIRVMAIVQTAVHEAVKAVPVSSATAAVAAANRVTLAKLLPSQEAGIKAAYEAALAGIPDGAAKSAGIEAGEKAAAAVLASRADDGAATLERYRPAAAAGSYVPTAAPAVPQWAQRKPWLMARADQFRPAPPPAMSSATWQRDFNEVKVLGARNSVTRTPEQTEIGRFWEFSLPSIYFNVARSTTMGATRDIAQNARLYASMAQAMDDALIAVMEAKYQHNFWRPVTAIRNGDADGNDATERDAGWVSLIDAPLHPEYPSAHSILAAAVGTVLKAEIGTGPVPVLSTTSPTLKGVTRQWTSIDAFMQEVADARIYEGIHFRHSTQVGLEMGRKIGALAASRYPVSAKP
jgi:hypothetical protein